MKHIIIGALVGYFLLPVMPIMQSKLMGMAQGIGGHQVAYQAKNW